MLNNISSPSMSNHAQKTPPSIDMSADKKISELSPIQKKEVLKEKLRSANNTVNAFNKINKEIKEADASIKKQNNVLSSLNDFIQQLDRIAVDKGAKTCIRVKNKQFKAENNGFFHKLFHHTRYTQEANAAANILHLSKNKPVTAEAALNTLQASKAEITAKQENLINNKDTYQAKLSQLQTNYNRAQTTIKATQTELNNIQAKEDKHHKKIANFSVIYQTNHGCNVINSSMRSSPDNPNNIPALSKNKVIDEYERVFGSEIFSKGGQKIKREISAHCSNIGEIVKNAIDAFYQPGQKTIKTYRGQGMTQQGINTLIRNFQSSDGQKIYRAGQFFSTSSSIKVGKDFAHQSKGQVEVIFITEGNSSVSPSYPPSMAFGGSIADGQEQEHLYSPKATFELTKIAEGKKSTQGKETYHIYIKETKPTGTKSNQPPVFPY